MEKEKCVCEHCGAPMYKYWHNLNVPLCRALFALYQKGEPSNIAHIGLSHNQINNFTKLQHWDFVRRVGPSLWDVTETGRDFLADRVQVFPSVQTYRGARCGERGKLVKISDIMGTEYRRIADYVRDREPLKSDAQIILFNE